MDSVDSSNEQQRERELEHGQQTGSAFSFLHTANIELESTEGDAGAGSLSSGFSFLNTAALELDAGQDIGEEIAGSSSFAFINSSSPSEPEQDLLLVTDPVENSDSFIATLPTAPVAEVDLLSSEIIPSAQNQAIGTAESNIEIKLGKVASAKNV